MKKTRRIAPYVRIDSHRLPRLGGHAIRKAGFIVVVCLVGVIGFITWQDVQLNRTITVQHSAFSNANNTGAYKALKLAALGHEVRLDDLSDAIEFVSSESDTTDFRLITLIRLIYGFPDHLSPDASAALRKMFLGVRYWMAEPGENPIVYWSENHQVMFAASEFLAGQLYPASVFRDGRTGEAHRIDARERLLFWLEQRWHYGFSEWNSHYYLEDMAALATLADFSADREVARKATIILDLLFFDVASQSFRGEFIVTSGRLYENNKMLGDEEIRRVIRQVLDQSNERESATGIDGDVLFSGYRAPAVLTALARDNSEATILATYGRNPDELGGDPAIASPERRIMALWGMEAFTNPEAISDSVTYIRDHGLLKNPFLAPFKQLNYRALIASGILPFLSSWLDLPTNGTVLGRANTYTYRSPDFEMSTTQDYRPGSFGNQQHIFGMVFGPGVTLFHTHPAVPPGAPSPNGNSPGYWTGTGILPVSCQHGSTNVSSYDLPDHAGYGREYLLRFTHLYVPLPKFDRYEVENNRLFLQYREALVAVTVRSSLERVGEDEFIQRGEHTYWITEASSLSKESFDSFVKRVKSATIHSSEKTVEYNSGGDSIAASEEEGCRVNGIPIVTPYPRQDSKYAHIARQADRMEIHFGGHGLVLDFDRLEREMN